MIDLLLAYYTALVQTKPIAVCFTACASRFSGYVYVNNIIFRMRCQAKIGSFPGQQHLLLRGKKDFQKQLRFKGGFEHHALFAHPSILSLRNKVKSDFTKDIQIERGMIFSCP